MGEATNSQLESVQIHEVLSNERRQMILTLLRDGEGSLTARELSERIAEIETGETPPPRNIRQSAYVSLHQTHLPKLDDLGIIDYDDSTKQVRLNERAEQVSVYMETVPKYGISWSEYYLGVALIGLLLLAGAGIGVPLIADVGGVVWSGLVFGLILVSATYQTVQQGSSLLHRVRQDD